MITFSARLLELLNQPVLNIIYCLKLKTLKYCTYTSDITLGSDVYTGYGPVFNVDAPRMDSVVDRDLYKIALTDEGFSLGALYDTNFTGAEAEVRACLVDYYTGVPETNLDDTVLVYRGIIESFNYEIDTSEQGRVLSTISCSNPMADLDSVRVYYTSKDFLKQVNPNDTAYNQIFAGSEGVSLVWNAD